MKMSCNNNHHSKNRTNINRISPSSLVFIFLSLLICILGPNSASASTRVEDLNYCDQADFDSQPVVATLKNPFPGPYSSQGQRIRVKALSELLSRVDSIFRENHLCYWIFEETFEHLYQYSALEPSDVNITFAVIQHRFDDAEQVSNSVLYAHLSGVSQSTNFNPCSFSFFLFSSSLRFNSIPWSLLTLLRFLICIDTFLVSWLGSQAVSRLLHQDRPRSRGRTWN